MGAVLMERVAAEPLLWEITGVPRGTGMGALCSIRLIAGSSCSRGEHDLALSVPTKKVGCSSPSALRGTGGGDVLRDPSSREEPL